MNKTGAIFFPSQTQKLADNELAMSAKDFMRTSSRDCASNRSFAKNANNSATQVAPQSRGSCEPLLKTGGFNMRGSDMFFPEPNDSISTKGES